MAMDMGSFYHCKYTSATFLTRTGFSIIDLIMVNSILAYNWRFAGFGNEGGFFNAIMSFPPNYPNSPPAVKFTSEIWHPNVYADGRVCISILHPPGDDPNGYELASERWTPVHT
ncbi:hypothetical protein Gohar_001828, partial [Gossypium harknessii]|nr:hypothetical protein [Gossypium harknessii]